MMLEDDRQAARPAESPASDDIMPGTVARTGGLDDAQVLELVSNAYWRLFEQFITLDRAGTNLPATAGSR